MDTCNIKRCTTEFKIHIIGSIEPKIEITQQFSVWNFWFPKFYW